MNYQLPRDLQNVRVHFVGIKGTGMAALVEIFFHAGAVISGSDVSERFYTDEILENLGLKALPFSSENITDDIQFVVYSSAYKLDKNPDLIEATKKNIPCVLYTQALGAYSELSFSCGICGVHGKTSTTGLTGTILREVDLPVQVLAGSVINSFGNSCTFTSDSFKSEKSKLEKSENLKNESFSESINESINKSINKPIFVAETCEYQRHFMSFCPQKIILTSVEPDHQDYYPTYESIRDAFVDYILKLPQKGDLIYCADDKGAAETALIAKEKRPDINLVAYGESALGDYKLTFLNVEDEKNKFLVELFNEEFYLKVPGRHEVLDACAGIALVCQLLKSYNKNPLDYKTQIARGLQNFSGGKRRTEIVGHFKTASNNDVIVVDDYGHHPTAVKTTLAGYREFYKNRKIIVDFMSHTYSRTQALLEEFAQSFESADVVILHKIYSSARENPNDFSITGKTLFEKVVEYKNKNKNLQKNNDADFVQNVFYFEEIMDAKDLVLAELEKPLPSKYSDGYLFVTMGAGDNWKLGISLLKE